MWPTLWMGKISTVNMYNNLVSPAAWKASTQTDQMSESTGIPGHISVIQHGGPVKSCLKIGCLGN